jgi:hypothetical protein
LHLTTMKFCALLTTLGLLLSRAAAIEMV